MKLLAKKIESSFKIIFIIEQCPTVDAPSPCAFDSIVCELRKRSKDITKHKHLYIARCRYCCGERKKNLVSFRIIIYSSGRESHENVKVNEKESIHNLSNIKLNNKNAIDNEENDDYVR